MAMPPTLTPLPPSVLRTLEQDFAAGRWTQTTIEFFLDLLKHVEDLERRLAALEP